MSRLSTNVMAFIRDLDANAFLVKYKSIAHNSNNKHFMLIESASTTVTQFLNTLLSKV